MTVANHIGFRGGVSVRPELDVLRQGLRLKRYGKEWIQICDDRLDV